MVSGMLVGFTVTLAIVFGLLAVLFRSLVWALIGIAPVLWTILVVYGWWASSARTTTCRSRCCPHSCWA